MAGDKENEERSRQRTTKRKRRMTGDKEDKRKSEWRQRIGREKANGWRQMRGREKEGLNN